MSKTTKKIFISIFATLLIFCTVFLFYTPKYSQHVRADEQSTAKLSDDNFLWKTETETHINAEKEKNSLSFTLKLKNAKLNNLLEYAPPVCGGLFNNTDYYYLNYYIHEFKIYRLNDNGSAVSPVSILIGYDYCKEDGKYIMNYTYARKRADYVTPERFEFNPDQYGGSLTKNGHTNEDLLDYINDNGYTHVCTQHVTSYYHTGNDYGLTWNTNPETLEKEMTIDFYTYSPYTTYFMEFSYYYYYPIAGRIWGTKDEVISGTIKSSEVSVSSLLKEMSDEGVLQNFCGDETTYNYAMEIITSGAKKDVKISYLEKIPESSFAKKITKTVSVPIFKGNLSLDDIYSYLNVETLDVLDSQLYEFRINQEGTVYEAYYLKNIWLRSITTDGNFMDYFLDINLSYEQTYYPFVTSGIISEEMYEYLFSKMLEKNPGAKGYKYNEIYGYFGIVAIPQTYTFNTIWVEMFDVKSSKSGILSSFSYELNLSYENYDKLLTEYRYGWLSKVWNGVAGFVAGCEWPATFYLFYSEPGTENAYIGEGGQTDPEDPGGAVIEEIQKGTSNVIAWLKSRNWNKSGMFISIVLIVVSIFIIKKYLKK